MKKNRLDALGRIYIPKKIRIGMDLEPGDALQFSIDPSKGELRIKKKQKTCLHCDGEWDLIEIKKEVYLCKQCAKTLFQVL